MTTNFYLNKKAGEKRLTNVFVISLLLISLFSISFVSAEEQTITGWLWNGVTDIWEYFFGGKVIATSENQPEGLPTIQSTGQDWTLTKHTGVQLEYFTTDRIDLGNGMAKICLYPKQNLKINSQIIKDSKAYLFKNNIQTRTVEPSDMEVETESGNVKKMCVNVDKENEEQIDFGQATVTYLYQDQNLINYNLDFADVNVSLSCEDVPQNDIFIYENPDNYKFGANGTFEGLKNCVYTITSNYLLEQDYFKVFLTEPNKRTGDLAEYYKTHQFKFHDICNKNFEPYNVTEDLLGENITVTHYNKSANCNFEVNDYSATISFLSDKNIDPTITDLDLDAVFDNVICEGGGIFCHLNISNSDILLYMPFDVNTGTTVYDWSEGNGDGTAVNQAHYITSGKYGGGFTFDGVGDYVGTTATFKSTNKTSISFWFNASSDTVQSDYLIGTSGAAAGQGLFCYFGWQVSLVCADVGSTTFWLNDSRWHHVVLSMGNAVSQDGRYFYLDGVYQSVGWANPNYGTYPVRIGVSADSFWGHYHGEIDEFMIINKTLTSTDVANIYKQGYQRFAQTGTHIKNQSITAGDNRVNISLNLSASQFNPSITNISLSVWDGSAWSGEANMTTGVNQTFTISDTATQLNMSFTYQSNASQFWSTILLPPISYWTFTSGVADTEYPQFSLYKDDNGSVVDAGTGHFNVTLLSTNGTVWLTIADSNISASNDSATPTIFNATYTFAVGGEYSYNWSAYGNGTSANYNKSETKYYTVNISNSIPPNITIWNPSIANFSYNNSANFNFTINATDDEGNVQECWLTIDNGVTNNSMFNTTQANIWNFTNTSMVDGFYQSKFYCNDSWNNINDTESIWLIIDTVNPPISISSPLSSQWFNYTSIEFNVSSNENISLCEVSITGGVSNITMQRWNDTFWNYTQPPISDNSYTGLFFCNDTAGNNNYTESVVFYVDGTFPKINFTAPTPDPHNTTTVLSREINITLIEKNLRNFTYMWDGINYSIYDEDLVLLLNLNNASGIGENDTHVVDVSNFGKYGIVTGAKVNTTGKFGQGFEFNQTSYINLSSMDFGFGSTAGKPITISAWVNVREGKTLAGKSFPIVDNQWDYDKEGFQLQLTTSSGVVFQTGNATRSSKYSFNKSDCYFENEWTHVVVVIEAQDLDKPRIYIDGYENRTDQNCSDGEWQAGLYNYQKTVLPTNPVKDTFVGGSRTATADHMFNGTIDEVMIWRRALNASEILQLYIGSLYKYNQTDWQYYANQSNLIAPHSYNYSACAIDRGLNTNCTEVRIVNITQVIDTIPPTVTIETPTPDQFICSASVTYNISIDEDWGNESVFSFDNFVTNTTMMNSTLRNFFYTNASSTDGTFQLNFSVNDTSGNKNMSAWINFSVDITPPTISVVYPVNFGNYSSSITELNTTYVETNCKSEWYSDDFGVTNSTFQSCGYNWSGALIGALNNEGNNTWTVYINDSCDYMVNTTVTFLLDTQPPYFMHDLENQSIYTNESLNYDINATDAGVGGTNYTINDTINFHINDTGWLKNITAIGVGEWFLNISINDTLGNTNSTAWNVTVLIQDIIPPFVNITTPINNTNSSDNGLDIEYVWTYSGEALESCWYSNDTYTINLSLGSGGVCSNITTLTWSEGQHNVTVYVNDTINNLNFTSVWFTVDSIPPFVNITEPINNTNTTDTQIDVNFTYSDTGMGISSCWYSNTSGVDNYTLACGTNISTATWLEGLNNITFYANDTMNNVNSSRITFTVDTTAPTFTQAPANQTIYTNQTLGYDLNATDASTILDSYITNDTRFEFNSTGWLRNITSLVVANYTFNISINDTLNNTYGELISISVITEITDTTNPIITIVHPPNNTNSTDFNLDVNYTFSDETGVDSCWYSDDFGVTNQTPVSCGTNVSGAWIYGVTYVTWWINDTSNNQAQSSVNFTIDNRPPYLTHTLTNQSMYTNQSLTYDINATDQFLLIDGYGVNDTTNFNINSTGWLKNITAVSVGTWFLNISWNDTLGNTNSSAWNLTVLTEIDVTAPTFDQAPANQTLYTNQSLFYNLNATDAEGNFDCFGVDDTTNFGINCTGGLVNITTLTVQNYTINVTINDSTNNTNSASFSIIVITEIADTTPPTFTIANYTHYANTSFSQTVTASDTSGISWYMLNDTTFFNISQTGVITNVSILPNVTIYNLNYSVNDTLGNTASALFWINITTIAFKIEIINPTSRIFYTYYKIVLDLQVNSTLEADTWQYNHNGSNLTFIPNTTIEFGKGNYNLIVFANNSANTLANDTVSFTVSYENEANDYYYLYFFAFAIAVLLLVVGFSMEDPYIAWFGGVIFVMMGIIIWTVGYPNLTNTMLQQGISFALWGVGVYIIVVTMMGIVEDNL